ncbi:recombinase family protein [Brevibacillus laterosporus]|uniref:recombinase family protein n=1 Tax=Brevibacillus laterosporus TaxID=1465 RepID=UPI000839D7E5|nr:recombinase family protein [Brevibacillus laterosporus]
MVGVYARVSTEEQARKGFSLKDQIAECRRKAKTDNVLEYVDEGISGEFLDRPALTKMRQDARDGLIKKIVCLDPDRLSRKLMNQLIITDELDKRGVELVFVNGEYAKTPEGNLFYSMRGAIAEFEKAKITERMSRGRRQKARQGKVLRDFQVYGYNFDKEHDRMIVNENEAEIVRLIFDLFTKPNNLVKGINGIAHFLTKKNIPTKRGANVWHRQVVRQILLNRAYIGEFYQNRWNTEGMLGNKHRDPEERIPMRQRPKEEWIQVQCPAIIRKETYEHAQQLMDESRRRWAKESNHRYLLSGLVRCGNCENTMTGRKSSNWGKPILEYTDVKNFSGAKHFGCGRKIKAKELENEVWRTIRTWLNQPNEIAAASEIAQLDQNSSLEEAEISRLEKEIVKAKSGRKRLLMLFSQGLDISQEEIQQSIRELKEREAELTKELTALTASVLHQERNRYSKSQLLEAVEYYLNQGREKLTFEEKQKMIRHIVREVRVFEDSVEIYTF